MGEEMKKRTYTQEFKLQAVELAKEIGMIAAGRQLGIADSNIYGWKEKFEGKKKLTQQAVGISDAELQELKQLRKENAELKKVNFILKQAAAFFSQDHIKSGLK
jgi:transposase